MPSVRYKNVSINVYPLDSRPGYWQFYDGSGKRITRSSEESAIKSAKRSAIEIFKGAIDLATLNPYQLNAVRRMVEADPSCKLIDEFLVWYAKQRPVKNTGEAIDEFLATKERNRGKSSRNVANLRQNLSRLPREVALGTITPQFLETILPESLAPKTRKNIRGSWVTFFRWAKRMEYLPHGEERTVAERVEPPNVLRKIPATYSPEEMAILLKGVSPDYLPWLVLASFAGIRSSEISPDRKGEKSPLDWSDFHWDRSLIIVRPETDKNNRRRVTPILPVVRDWLEPISKKSGRVGPLLNPGDTYGNGDETETTRLGKLIGGWKRNAPRHSFISYRAAIVGLAQTSMEAGNSESEAKKSYNDAKGADQANEWFGLTRKVVMELP